MLFERIESEGLAHYSYVVGDGDEACVIDPRRDCGVYQEMAVRQGHRITSILETHRNEDYVVGSRELAARTGARIWHADGHLAYQYGDAVRDGQEWMVGQLSLMAIHSPGHTLGSMSYLLRDPQGFPWVIFTGDSLFAGAVGRVDFVGEDRLEEMAGHLYDTIFTRLLPLGDGIIVCPAHGAGSVCGSSIASRVWTTVGLERRLNPKLQAPNRAGFVADVAVPLARAPYFRRMELVNLGGSAPMEELPVPEPISADAFAERLDGAIVLDTRCPACFAAAHIPGAYAIPQDEIPSFAGWFLPYDRPILLVADASGTEKVVRYLVRLGYDRVGGVLRGCMKAWHSAGRRGAHAGIVNPAEFASLLDAREQMFVLDVRSERELERVPAVKGAHHIHIIEIPERIDDVPQDRRIYVMCATGTRACIVTSLLLRAGHKDVAVVLGGMAGLERASRRHAPIAE